MKSVKALETNVGSPNCATLCTFFGLSGTRVSFPAKWNSYYLPFGAVVRIGYNFHGTTTVVAGALWVSDVGGQGCWGLWYWASSLTGGSAGPAQPRDSEESANTIRKQEAADHTHRLVLCYPRNLVCTRSLWIS